MTTFRSDDGREIREEDVRALAEWADSFLAHGPTERRAQTDRILAALAPKPRNLGDPMTEQAVTVRREYLVIQGWGHKAKPNGYFPRDVAEKLLKRTLNVSKGTCWFTKEESEKLRKHEEWITPEELCSLRRPPSRAG